jgi:UDP-N-acetylglucosamine:LPS N-acetylglucosamine transferase
MMIKIYLPEGAQGAFLPLIAVAEEVNKLVDEQKIANVRMYYFSDSPYDQEALFDNQIIYKEIKTGKMRTYFSVQNFFDIFKTIGGSHQRIFCRI